MKKIKTSFLFFYLYSSWLFCVNSNTANTQQTSDSLTYYYNLTINPKSSTDLAPAYNFYKKHKTQSLLKKDTLGAIQDLRLIAIIQNRLGFLHDSEGSSVEALKLLNYLKVSDMTTEARIGIYNQLGLVYRELFQYNKALEYYDKILEIVQTPQQINIVLNNKAFVYSEQNKFELAVNEFTKVYKNSLELDNIRQTARALNNLGSVQSKLNHPEALTNMKNALNIRLKENDISGIYSSYNHLTEYYLSRGNNKKALLYANKAYHIAKSMNNVSYKLDALSNLVDLNGNLNIIEFKKLSDSIALAKQLNENKYAAIKYDYTEKERTAQESEIKFKASELENEKEKSKKIFYQALAAFVLLLAIFLYYILKVRYKKEKLQQVYNTETRISKKIHDELANDVFQVMTQLQSTPKTNEKAIDDLDQIYSKTRDISLEYSALDVKGDFKVLLQDLLLSYNSDEVNVITKGITEVHWESVSEIKKTTIYKVLQELMINMKKHSQASVAVISFNETRKKISISYNDNGIGCVLKKNTGLRNVENRIASIKGSLIFESEINKGFKVKITV